VLPWRNESVVYDCRDKCFNQFLASQLGLLWRSKSVLYGRYDNCFKQFQFLSSQLGLLRRSEPEINSCIDKCHCAVVVMYVPGDLYLG
jgi:hypothetical protein